MRQYFTPKQGQNTDWHRGPRFGHICCTLWASAPQYQLESFDPIQLKTVRNVRDLRICETSPRCEFSTAFVIGSILGNCLTCYSPLNSLTAQHVTNFNTIHTICICGTPLLCSFVGTSFQAPRSCGMVYLRLI